MHQFSRTMAFGLILASTLGLAGSANAGLVVGTDSGIFVNSQPSGSPYVSTGTGTNFYTWGDGNTSFMTGPNSLGFAATAINTTTDTPFKIGTLTYFNGTTISGTTPNSVDLQVGLNLTQPGIISQNFVYTLGLVSTPNTGNAMDNADYVYLTSNNSSFTFMAGGATYSLQLTGFQNVIGDGFLDSTSSQFHVQEDQTASADLYGTVTTLSPAPVPEPSSIVLCGMAAVMSLGYTLRRRHRAATS